MIFVQKVQALGREVRRGMIEPNLMLMRQSDEQFPLLRIARQRLSGDGRRRSSASSGCVRSKTSASTCTPGKPDRRSGPVSESGWISITGSDRNQPLAASHLPWSIGNAKNKINPISRCREALN